MDFGFLRSSMERILSQEEIDALLKAVPKKGKSAEELKERKISEYDFRRYGGIAREYFPIFQEVHESFGFLTERFLCDKLGFTIRFNLVDQDVATLGEFVTFCPNPSYIAIFRLEPMLGDIIVNIEPPLVHALVDIWLGGDGKISKNLDKLTLIEENFIPQFAYQLLELLRDAWKQFVSVELKVFSEGTNPLTVAPTESTEDVLVSTFSLSLGGKGGSPLTMRVSYSYEATRSFVSNVRLHGKTKYSVAKGEFRKEVENILLSKDIRAEIYLGKSSVSVGELIELETGDVVKLNTGVNDELLLCVGRKPKWFGKPGTHSKKMVFTITRICEKGGGTHESTEGKA